MPITKSTGVTPTERLLATLGERSFLRLWSYPNPFKDDGHELCDLLVVFDNHVLVFFDRHVELVLEGAQKAPEVLWARWKRKVIDDQVRTAHGAERYIRSGRPIYLDSKRAIPFPFAIDIARAIVHKIIVAHGAVDACKQYSDENIYGSLAVTYCNPSNDRDEPFFAEVDKSRPVHIFDTHNLPIVLSELDTIYDFTAYLDAKLAAIGKLDFLSYCGEEDLLAHYLTNLHPSTRRHFIGVKNEPNLNGLHVGEGEWKDFSESETYRNTKRVNSTSYLWDEILQKTSDNALSGRLLGDSALGTTRSAIYEMAREPRFSRRALSDEIMRAARSFPDVPQSGDGLRLLTGMPSFYPEKFYVFLQLQPPPHIRARDDYREVRQRMLEIACGAAKNRTPSLKTIVGIAVDALRHSRNHAEDFLLMDCESWSDEQRAHYEEANRELEFLSSPTLRERRQTVTEFVPPSRPVRPPTANRRKVGRNEPCPCGSGVKFKKCCLDRT